MEREHWAVGLNLLLENLVEQAMVARAREHNRHRKNNVIKNYVISPDPYQL
jgi:hypothetical protein